MKPTSLPKLVSNPLTRPPALAKLRCPELSRPPKSPRGRGVTFRGLTPGNPTKIIATQAYDNRPFVDPLHPAAQRKGKGSNPLVHWSSPSDAFRMIAGPKALLLSPDTKVEPGYSGGTMYERWVEKLEKLKLEKEAEEAGPSGADANIGDSPTASRKGKEKDIDEAGPVAEGPPGDTGVALSPAMERWLARRKDTLSKAVPMSIQFANSKAKMGGKVFYAFTAKKRVRAAISLIVNQGAKVVGREEEDGRENADMSMVKKEIVFDLEEAKSMEQDGWVMKDWTYVVMPTMKLYRMPFTELIPELREALQFIKKKAMAIEESWHRPPKPFEPPKHRSGRPGATTKAPGDHAKQRKPNVK